MSAIPAHLRRNKRWLAVFHLFQNHEKLQKCLTTKYFVLKEERIKIQTLKKDARVWSSSEKFMLNLALHCYNERNKVDLGDMDYLDPSNTKLALEALKIRYS